MTACCHQHEVLSEEMTAAYRRVLWIVIAINGGMFAVEASAGIAAKSVALKADALDFLGDAATYLITLLVLGMSIRWRSGAALLKGTSMALFGIWVLTDAGIRFATGGVPDAPIIGAIGTLALVANVASAVLLYRYREGDANMRSVWLCTRNDAVGNVAVIAAGLGVHLTASAIPDLVVGAGMALLALTSSLQVVRQATAEWRSGDVSIARNTH